MVAFIWGELLSKAVSDKSYYFCQNTGYKLHRHWDKVLLLFLFDEALFHVPGAEIFPVFSENK